MTVTEAAPAPAAPEAKASKRRPLDWGNLALSVAAPIVALLIAMGITSVTHRGIISAITPVGQPLVNSARELDTQTLRRLSVGTYSVLQLDIVSYPGNSGSPLYDVNTGEVLGIVNMVFVRGSKESAITNPSGISFAIPSSFLKALLKP